MKLSRIVCLVGLATGISVLWACGTDATGIEACREIEYARCEVAPTCGFDMSRPRHWGGAGTDVTSCQRFYRDACLHGLATPVEPGNVVVQECVDAIRGGDCEVVKNPELHPSCAFLVPPPPADPPAAAEDASAAGDAAVDAGS